MNSAVLDAIRSLPVKERAVLLALVKQGTPIEKSQTDSLLNVIDETIKDDDIKDELLILVTSSKAPAAETIPIKPVQKNPPNAIIFKKKEKTSILKKEEKKPEPLSKEGRKVEILLDYCSRYHSTDINRSVANIYSEASKARGEGLPYPFHKAPYLYAFHAQGGGIRRQSYKSDGKFHLDIATPQISGGAALVIKRKGEIHKAKSKIFETALPSFRKLLRQFNSGRLKGEGLTLLTQLFPEGVPLSFLKETGGGEDLETLKKVILSEEGGAVISHVSPSGRLKMAYYSDKKLDSLIELHNSKMEMWETSERLLLFGGEDLSLDIKAAKEFSVDDKYIETCLDAVDDKILRKSCIIYIPRKEFKAFNFERIEERVTWQETVIDPKAVRRRLGSGDRKKKLDIAALNKEYGGVPNFMAGVPTISASLARSILSSNDLFYGAVVDIKKNTKPSDIESDLKKITKPILSSALSGDATGLAEVLRSCKVFTPSHIDSEFLKSISEYGNVSTRKRVVNELIKREGDRFISKAPFSWIEERTKKGSPRRSWHPRLVKLLQDNIASEKLDRRTRYAIGRLLYCQLSDIEHKLLDIAGLGEKVTPPKGVKDSTPKGLRIYSDLIASLYEEQLRGDA